MVIHRYKTNNASAFTQKFCELRTAQLKLGKYVICNNNRGRQRLKSSTDTFKSTMYKKKWARLFVFCLLLYFCFLKDQFVCFVLTISIFNDFFYIAIDKDKDICFYKNKSSSSHGMENGIINYHITNHRKNYYVHEIHLLFPFKWRQQCKVS